MHLWHRCALSSASAARAWPESPAVTRVSACTTATCLLYAHRGLALLDCLCLHEPCDCVQTPALPAASATRKSEPSHPPTPLLQGGAAVLGEAGLQTVKDMAVHLYGKADDAFRTFAPHLTVGVSADGWAGGCSASTA